MACEPSPVQLATHGRLRANPGTTQKLTRKRLKKDMVLVRQGFIDAEEAGLIKQLGYKKGYAVNDHLAD
jgi:hypothetical protein